jgi:hypothetical protein
LSNYQDFLKEKQLIDEFIKNDYKIIAIIGSLDGDEVELEKEGIPEKQSILLANPDSRKYITTLLIKRQLQNHN